MRSGILAAVPLLLLTACPQPRDPLKPAEPALQIIIPDTPGWSPSTNNNRIYGRFEYLLRDRIKGSEQVVRKLTWHQKDLSTVVTLYGDHAGQIVTLTLPFLKQAGLPTGTTITKYDGVGDQVVEMPVLLGS